MIGKCTSCHGPGGFFFPHLSMAVLQFAVALWTHWRAGTATILVRRTCLQHSCLVELDISKAALSSWSWFCFPLVPLLFLPPHSLQNSMCFAPPGSSSRLLHALCHQPFISHHKAGAAGVPLCLWCLVCCILAICFLWYCKAREAWKGSRIKPSDGLVCLAV